MKTALGLVLATAMWGQAQAITKAVEPKWGFDTSRPHVVEPVWVEVLVDRGGEPLGFFAEVGIPDALVESLRKSRFASQSSAYTTGLTMQVHRPLERYRVRRGVSLQPEEQTIARATLDLQKALASEAKLADKPESAAERATLVHWAAEHPGPEADAMRVRQIAWLVEHAPMNDILRAPAGRINARAGPGANPAAYARVRDLWARTMQTQGGSPAIYQAIAGFLAIDNAEMAEGLLKQLESQVYVATPLLGKMYAWAAIGVTGIDLERGRAVAAEDTLPRTAFAARAQKALESSTDPRMLWAALEALHDAAASLGEAGEAPEGFGQLCLAIVVQAMQVLPDAGADCTVPAQGAKPDIVAAKIIRQEKPSYPRAAQGARWEGRVVFQAVIGTNGKIRDLELARGAFVFADAARGPLSRWEYSPTLVNGLAVDVTTDLEVNYDIR